MSWTPERVDLLRQLWCIDGWSGSQIATRLGGDITRNSVIGKVARLGLNGGSRTESTRAQQHTRPPKIKVERRATPPRNMIRFGNIAIPKSSIPLETAPVFVPLEAPPTVERPTPMSAPEPPASTPVTLAERRPDQCGWPVNDGAPFLYCGALKTDRRYCDRHAWIAIRRGGRVAA